MQRHTQAEGVATAISWGPRAMNVAGMMLLVAKGGAFQAYHGMVRRSCVARMRFLSSRPAAFADRAPRPQGHDTAAAAGAPHPAVEAVASPEHNEVESLSFFERIGRPRYVAAPMVEQSEAGESCSRTEYRTAVYRDRWWGYVCPRMHEWYDVYSVTPVGVTSTSFLLWGLYLYRTPVQLFCK